MCEGIGMHMRVYVWINVYIACMYACLSVFYSVCTHVHICEVSGCVCECVCMFVCVCICAIVCVCVYVCEGTGMWSGVKEVCNYVPFRRRDIYFVLYKHQLPPIKSKTLRYDQF